VLFVLEKPLFTLPDFFHHEENSADEAKIKNDLKQRLLALGHDGSFAIFVLIDDTADRVYEHCKDNNQTLIVTAYNHKLTESIIKKNNVATLLLKNDRSKTHNAKSSNIILPIELNDSTLCCVELTKNLFGDSSIKLIYDNHFQTDPQTNQEQEVAYELLKEQTSLEGDTIEEFVWNQSDFGEDFEAIEKHLVEYVRKGEFDLCVLCSKDGESIFTQALCFSLIHSLETDFLFFSACQE
jgi:hypothetical protein